MNARVHRTSTEAFAGGFHRTVAAYGVVEARLDDMPALRDQPGEPTGRPLPPRFLRHADEQTVVGLAAVLRAIQDHNLGETCFDQWGVLAAPHFPGRLAGAATLTKFQQIGAPAINAHIIPQHSLHSASSAISIALGMRGPNFGIGGGHEALAEGLTVALTLLDSYQAPGVWLVLTQWDPEPIPDGQGSTNSETICRGVALALVGATDVNSSLRLSMDLRNHSGDAADHRDDPHNTTALAQLARCLKVGPACLTQIPWRFGLPWGGRIELAPSEQRQRKAA